MRRQTESERRKTARESELPVQTNGSKPVAFGLAFVLAGAANERAGNIEMAESDANCVADLQAIYDQLRKLDTGKNGKIDQAALKAEAGILRDHNLPFGLSLLCIAEKP